MVVTIERAIYPLSIVSFIIGFGILRYPLGHSRLRLSICYILIVWSVYVYVFHYVISIFTLRLLFNDFLTFYMVAINIVVAIMSIIITCREYEKFYMCIRKLGIVDDTLEKLGTPKEYRQVQKSIKWILIIWFTMICVTWTTDSLWFMQILNDKRAILVPFVMDYTIHINTFTDIVFAFILRYIGTRLDKINNCIEQLSEIEECGLRCTWKKSLVVTRHYIRSTQNHKRVLWTIMHLHSELCRIARNINSLFGMQMTMQMVSYFIILCGMFYFQYTTLMCIKHVNYRKGTIRLKLLLCSDIWFTIILTKLVSLNHICESVSVKAQKTKAVVHKLTNLIRFAEAREVIYQFSQQISLQPLQFSGMGLFFFGYRFIRKFFAWIFTIIMLIVQMDTSPISQIIISSRHNITC